MSKFNSLNQRSKSLLRVDELHHRVVPAVLTNPDAVPFCDIAQIATISDEKVDESQDIAITNHDDETVLEDAVMTTMAGEELPIDDSGIAWSDLMVESQPLDVAIDGDQSMEISDSSEVSEDFIRYTMMNFRGLETDVESKDATEEVLPAEGDGSEPPFVINYFGTLNDEGSESVTEDPSLAYTSGIADPSVQINYFGGLNETENQDDLGSTDFIAYDNVDLNGTDAEPVENVQDMPIDNPEIMYFSAPGAGSPENAEASASTEVASIRDVPSDIAINQADFATKGSVNSTNDSRSNLIATSSPVAIKESVNSISEVNSSVPVFAKVAIAKTSETNTLHDFVSLDADSLTEAFGKKTRK